MDSTTLDRLIALQSMVHFYRYALLPHQAKRLRPLSSQLDKLLIDSFAMQYVYAYEQCLLIGVAKIPGPCSEYKLKAWCLEDGTRCIVDWRTSDTEMMVNISEAKRVLDAVSWLAEQSKQLVPGVILRADVETVAQSVDNYVCFQDAFDQYEEAMWAGQ